MQAEMHTALLQGFFVVLPCLAVAAQDMREDVFTAKQ